MVAPKKGSILLESGTNEMEIMEFTISGETFGINVAKVREIMFPSPVKRMPHSHPTVEGVFRPRNTIITVIDLPKYLDLAKEHTENSLFIVTGFNKVLTAFRVHTVEGITRISWQAIEKPHKTIYGDREGVVTGIARYEDRLITILDFEKITSDIAPITGIQSSEIDRMGERVNNTSPVVVAEDSALLSKMIIECLNKAGYINILKFDNGEEAWKYLEGIMDCEEVDSKASIIITDIEMPKMDGHRLTKLVKSNDKLKSIPVVIFSSLIDQEMYRKGQDLGANGQLSKPDIGNLVEVIDKLIIKK